jgi:peptide/nickel transport system permease protein
MRELILRRLAIGLLTLWLISILSFVIIQLPPGDFVTTYVAQLAEDRRDISQGRVEALRHEYGLDQPLYVQYGRWMGHMLQGDFGRSLDLKRPVSEVIGEKLPLTVVLSLVTLALTWAIALPLGVYTARHQYSVGDYAVTAIGFLALGVPEFLLALVVMYFAFVNFGVNITGLFSPEYENAGWGLGKVLNLLWHLPLPALLLAVLGTAAEVRILRANLLDELRKPYVMTARAKGLTERRLVYKYPFRVALNPFASRIGFIFPTIVSGTVIVGVVLDLPTLGPVLLRALTAQDMFLAGTIVFLLGVLTVVGTFVSDLVLMWLDPRIRHRSDQ